MAITDVEERILEELDIFLGEVSPSVQDAFQVLQIVVGGVLDDVIGEVIPAITSANVVLEKAMLQLANDINDQTAALSTKAAQAITFLQSALITGIEDITIGAISDLAKVGQAGADAQSSIADTTNELLIELFQATTETIQQSNVEAQLITTTALQEIGITADTLRRSVGGLISNTNNELSSISSQLQNQVQSAITATVIAGASGAAEIVTSIRRVFSDVGSDVNELRISLAGDADQTQVLLGQVVTSMSVIAKQMKEGSGSNFISGALGFLNSVFSDKV